MSKTKAVVLYDYDPEVADELKLRVGDVLTNIKKIEDGWCQGVLNGKTGMFPDNFVKMEEDKTPPPKPPSTKRKSVETKRLMKATFAYDPQNSDELELKVDDIVEIIKEEEEGWALGTLNGRKGVFPTNFCAPYTAVVDTTPDKGKENDNHDPAQAAPPKKVQGVGFGNIFGDGPIKLKKSITAENKNSNKNAHEDKPAPKPANVEKPVTKPAHIEKPAAKPAYVEKPKAKHGHDESTNAVKPGQNEKISAKRMPEESTLLKKPSAREKVDKVVPSSANKAKPVERCRVSFDYTATTADELSLAIGEIVTIITKECEDEGWWEGEKTDKDGKKHRGFFPDNFVLLLPTEEPKLQENSSVQEATGQATNEPKAKATTNAETDQTETDGKQATVAKNHSQKKTAPQIPSVNLKPEPEDSAASDLAAVVDSTNDEQQLVHYRRVSGPKNRRRPGSTGRRERAKEAAEEAEAIPPQVDSEPDSPKPDAEPATPPQIAPKKEAPRGIQVMPIPGGSDKAGEKPAWLKNLKRTSQKKEVPPKPEEPTNETPDWLANIRKKPKPVPPGDKTPSPVVPGKPGPTVTSPKPVVVSPATRSSLTSSTSHTLVRPTSPSAKTAEKPFTATRTSKKEVEAAVTTHDGEEKSKPEAKKHPVRPPVPSQHATHPVEIPKKPPTAATKPKPPPSKVKPALPSAKPHPVSTSVDELKEEIKALKEQITNFQKESSKEISRLSSELEVERNKRIDLQSEVASLTKKLG